ncbi:MAG: STAS domain-containing protein [Aeromonadaceae bacterium]
MNITLDTIQNAKIIILDGELDADACEALTPLVESLPDDASEVVLDLTDVPFVDSSGIGLLIFLFRRLHHHHVPLSLVCPQGQPMSMLRVLRIDRTVPCFADRDNYLAYRQTLQPDTGFRPHGLLH